MCPRLQGTVHPRPEMRRTEVIRESPLSELPYCRPNQTPEADNKVDDRALSGETGEGVQLPPYYDLQTARRADAPRFRCARESSARRRNRPWIQQKPAGSVVSRLRLLPHRRRSRQRRPSLLLLPPDFAH